MSSELMRRPSMSKMQARTAGKLVFVSFGFYRSRMLAFDNAFARCCIYIDVYVGGLTLF